MTTIYILALVTPFAVLAGVLGDLPPSRVALSAAEMAALAVVLREVAIPLMQAVPTWDRLPVSARRALIVLVAIGAAFLEGLVAGNSPVLSLLHALGSAGVAMAAHEGAKRHEKRKGYEQAPPPSGDVEVPVGDPPPLDEDEQIIE